jgi:thymidylate synthase (FAD)
MPVRLIDHSPTPDLKVATAALTSITGSPPSDIYFHLVKNGMWEDDSHKLIDVLNSGHQDILEHVTFTFSLNDISRLASFLIVRHRIPTFTQISQRYTPVNESSIVTPESIEGNERAKELFDEFIGECFRFYHDAIEAGHEREDTRYGLPIAVHTHMVFTANLRELLHIISSNIQFVPKELADISQSILSCIREKAPLCAQFYDDTKDTALFGEYGERQSLRDANRLSSKMLFEGSETQRKARKKKKKRDGVTILQCSNNPVELISRRVVEGKTGGHVGSLPNHDCSKIIKELKETGTFPREFEYAHVTFAYEESLASAHQDIRHRMRTMTVQPFDSIIEGGEVVIPPSFKGGVFGGRLEDLHTLSDHTYRSLLKEGIPIPDASYVILNAAKAHIISDFDFRNLCKAFALRCCLRAQWEIRDIYDAMLREMIRITPLIFRDAGPGCRRPSGCPEGILICNTPRGKYFPQEVYMKKHPDTPLAKKLRGKA